MLKNQFYVIIILHHFDFLLIILYLLYTKKTQSRLYISNNEITYYIVTHYILLVNFIKILSVLSKYLTYHIQKKEIIGN